jgi:serine/threonine protein kinase
MVMDYIPDGDLRKYLRNNCDKSDFKSRLNQLYSIAEGLKNIHEKELIHRDFHPGNILNKRFFIFGNASIECYITDLGLCKPANQEEEDEIFGVLPYVAPEVLKGERYTLASDIYS